MISVVSFRNLLKEMNKRVRNSRSDNVDVSYSVIQ